MRILHIPCLISALSVLCVVPADALAATAHPKSTESIVLGMGCFWGAEKRMAALPGVLEVESAYAGGDAPAPGYQHILSTERSIRQGQSQERNHAEVIRVTFDPQKTSLTQILIAFWVNHDPTQGDRQGNDMGSNYRSAIYYSDDAQKQTAQRTRDIYQQALNKAGLPKITTEIAPLRNYTRAENYHQNYLQKNPDGYCGLGGTGVAWPTLEEPKTTEGAPMQATSPLKGVTTPPPLSAEGLSLKRQLIVFEADYCGFCKLFRSDILQNWHSPVPVATSTSSTAPQGWQLEKPVLATPTIVLFENAKEVARYSGYSGKSESFWQWLGFHLLSPEQQRIAFDNGTELPFTGSYLDEKRAGTYVDPITGAPLFRSDSKYDSGSGWPSFFTPVEGAITMHPDRSHKMNRVEVRSASSGIHLGHVFDDGPPPTGRRFCINGDVLRFVPDKP